MFQQVPRSPESPHLAGFFIGFSSRHVPPSSIASILERLDAVSCAEFSGILDRSKAYVSKLKKANRLILKADSKRVLVEKSIAKINATEDIGKWPLTIYHQQARDKKRSDEQA